MNSSQFRQPALADASATRRPRPRWNGSAFGVAESEANLLRLGQHGARRSRSALVKPSFCQNGPDRRENSQAHDAPACAACSSANMARRERGTGRTTVGATATLRISASVPSRLSSKPVLTITVPLLLFDPEVNGRLVETGKGQVGVAQESTNGFDVMLGHGVERHTFIVPAASGGRSAYRDGHDELRGPASDHPAPVGRSDQRRRWRRGSTADEAAYAEALQRIIGDPSNDVLVLEDELAAVIGTLQLTVIPGMARRGSARLLVEAVRVAGTERSSGVGTSLMRWLTRRCAYRCAPLLPSSRFHRLARGLQVHRVITRRACPVADRLLIPLRLTAAKLLESSSSRARTDAGPRGTRDHEATAPPVRGRYVQCLAASRECVCARLQVQTRQGREGRPRRSRVESTDTNSRSVKRRGCSQPVSCMLTRATVLVPLEDLRREPRHGTTVPRPPASDSRRGSDSLASIMLCGRLFSLSRRPTGVTAQRWRC
ncbi:hypothetical protein Pfo_031665 [Paulownia fortunei]|nr:hypothetical protein Pfo_031665 [Paulownia fortunei]